MSKHRDWPILVDFLTGPKLRCASRRQGVGRAFAMLSGALVVMLGAQLAVAPADADALRLAQAPPRILGCDITIDIGRTVDCLRGAVDREVKRAERDVRRAADQQIGNLQTQLDSAQKAAATVERQARLEVAKAEAQARSQLAVTQAQLATAQREAQQLQQQLANNAFMAQLEWQRLLLTELKKQQQLFDCLAKSGNVDIGQMLQQFSTNPAAFAQGQVNEVMRTVSTAIPAAISAELASLGRGVASTDRTVLIRRGMDSLQRVGQQVPGVGCLLQTVPPQLRAQMESAIGSTLNEAERQARALIEGQILPAVRQGIASQLRGGFDQVIKAIPSPVATVNQELHRRVPFLEGLTLTEREMRAVARGVLLERQAFQIQSGSEALQAFTTTLASNGAPQAVADARARVETALRGTNDYDQLYAALGVELLRSIGHKYIDSPRPGHGGFLVNQGFSLLQLSGDTTQHLVVGLCGLIPEAGGIICGVVMQIVMSVWNGAVVPQLEREVSNVIHAALDGSMDKVRTELGRNLKLSDIKSRLGPADALIAAIPSEQLIYAWSNGFIERDIQAFDRFSGGVLSLTTAAARPR